MKKFTTRKKIWLAGITGIVVQIGYVFYSVVTVFENNGTKVVNGADMLFLFATIGCFAVVVNYTNKDMSSK